MKQNENRKKSVNAGDAVLERVPVCEAASASRVRSPSREKAGSRTTCRRRTGCRDCSCCRRRHLRRDRKEEGAVRSLIERCAVRIGAVGVYRSCDFDSDPVTDECRDHCFGE